MIDAVEYYRSPHVQELIAEQMKYREVMVIKRLENKNISLRPFKVYTKEHFSWLYNRLHLDKIPFDLYVSVACIRLPKLPSNPNQLKEARTMLKQMWEDWFSGKNTDFMSSYDYFVDCDATSPDDEPLMISWAHEIAKEIPKLGTIEIWATGSGGTHVLMRGVKCTPEFVRQNIEEVCRKLDIPLRIPKPGVFNEPCFVDNSIYDFKRVRRCPHSIHSKYGIVMKKVM